MTGLRRSGLRWFVSLLAVAALLAGLMRDAAGAIVLGSSAGTQGVGVSSLTWSHTIAAGSNRLLIVRVANINAGVSVSSVSYGGVALTELQTATSGGGPSNVRSSVWYRLAPAVGTANVVVSLSGSTRVQGYSTDLTGVSQTTPFGTVATATGTNNAPTVTATGAAGDLMFDTAAAQGGAGSATAGGGQAPISGSTGGTASDVLGMGSTKAGAASVTLSWSTTASSPWVSIGVAIKQAAGYTVSGTVFEDVNYAFGAGRPLAAGGVGVNGATVELYNGSGAWVSSTTTASGGTYSFASLSAGTYHVRVVNSTVPSQRSGAVASLRGVMTYRSNASSGSAVAVTDFVGGTNPALVDPGAGSSGATFNTTTGVFSAVLSGTAQSYSAVTVSSANIGSVDFGFNFDTVVNTNDAGQGSLRQAIINANTLGGDASLAQVGRGAAVENLVFRISNGTAGDGLRSSINLFSGGVATIAPTSALPTITSRLVIDAQTQPGWTSAPLIDINGAGAGSGVTGLALQALSGSIVRGLVIRNFTATGLSLDTVNGSTVAGNYLGLNAAGTAAAGNGTQGLNLWNSNNNTIGGTTAADRNVISGNANIGIVITGNGGNGIGNVVRGNYVGTNAAGTAALPNGSIGVYFASASNTVGGTTAGAGNLISGNTYAGLALDVGATGSTVQGNRIGTDAAGTAALANGTHGIHVLSATNTIGGTAAGAGNVISGNAEQGVWVQANSNLIQGNIIGLNAAGNAKLRNGQNGIVLSAADSNTIGGSAAGARNVISGHDSLADYWDGVFLFNGSDNNTIQGNYLGTDSTGTVGFGNSYGGVTVYGGVNNTIGGTGAGQGNLIAHNGHGVEVTHSTGAATGNRISGNSMHSNVNGGIWLEGGLPANDGTTTVAKGNLLTDAPVFTSASYDGSTLSVAGYVGSAAGQAAFANHTVEVFASATTSGNGQGRTYLGALSTGGSDGNFSGSLSGVSLAAGTYITATATSAANNTSIFSANLLPTVPGAISGTVFEDLNYGGGAGRSLAVSGGTGLAGARVELYDGTGTFVSATTSAAGGAYSFTSVTSGAYTVRVANTSVLSSRSGASASQIGVNTYRTEAASGSAVAVTDHVGGLDPASADAAAGAGGTVLWTLCAAENATCSFGGTRIVRYGAYSAGSSRWVTRVLTGGTACSNGVFGDPYSGAPKNCYLLNAAYQSVANVAVGTTVVTGIDFGFNFSTVVNTNDSGQGSLRQFITNANALGGKAALAQSGNRRDLANAAQALPAATETSIFMIPRGAAVAGLRATVPSQLISGVAAVVITSTLPAITAASVALDGSTQTANIGDTNAGLLGAGGTVGVDALTLSQVARPEVELTFASLASGVAISANNASVRGLALRSTGTSALGNGAVSIANDVTGATIEANLIGSVATALTVPAVNQGIGAGVVSNGADNGTVRNNLIAYFTNTGVWLGGTASNGWLVEANEIRDGGLDFNNADGVALNNGGITLRGNRITGTSTQAILFSTNTSGSSLVINNTLSGNGVGPTGSASIQSNTLVTRSGVSGVRVEANIINANYGAGVAVNSGASSIALTRNLVYGNGSIPSRNGTAATGQIDIDLNAASDSTNLGTAPFVTANDSGDADSGGNNLQNHPVLSSAVISGGTQLIVSGTLNSNASGYYRIEFFGNTSPNGSGRGGAQSYLGFANVATDSGGNASFSSTLTATVAMGSYVTATATKTDAAYTALSDSSEFAPNVQAGLSLQGTVFEDLNYGGGAGRARAASGGVGVDGARVELYDSAGAFVSATTTAGGGAYRFDVAAAGAYLLRVVSSSVPSSRSGYAAALVGVLTYRGNAASGAVVAVTDFVGGTNPALADPGNGAGGTLLNTSTFVFSAGLSGTAHAVAPVTVSGSSIAGIDFGFNFDTVVNTNDSGQGSLRQALINANTLTGDASLAQSGRAAAIENLVFMIGNGTAAAGLRSAINLFSGGVASVAPASALPTLTAPVVIDAQTQPGWTVAPIVEINGNGAGSTAGLTLNGAGSVVRGLVINRFNGAGLSLGAAGITVAGNWIGLNNAGTAAAANSSFGIYIVAGGSNTIGGSSAAARNVISGNGNHGFEIAAGNSNIIQGNYVGTNAAGSAAVANAGAGLYVHASTGSNTLGGSSAGQGNVISGNTQEGIVLRGGSGNNVLRGNIIGLNATASVAIANAAGIALSISGSNNRIGGTGATDGNVISGNTGAGVIAFGNGSSGNSILGNSIYANGSIGIDLGTAAGTSGDGITANDGAKTAGQPNLRMDSPVFTSARSRGTQLTLAGYIGTAAGQAAFASSRVEVFISDSTSANGSGRTWLGALTADASGNFSGTITMPYNALRAGSVLTGTATDTADNTSEFGANFSGLVVDWLINHNGDGVDANPGDGLCETSTPGQCTLRAAIMESNAWAGADLAVFDLPSCPGAGCVITPASALPAITGQLTLDGQTQPGWSSAPLVDLRGEGAGASSDGLTVNANGSIVRGLAVGGFLQSGIRINANNVLIEANHVGVQPDGTTARANGGANTATGGVYVAGGTGIVIGGATVAQRNVLSGNGGSGVRANGGTATILGNYIGTNAAGTAALGNGRWGVSVVAGTGHRVGGAAAGEGNVISGNGGDQRGGVLVNGVGQTVQGNTIGLNAARSAAIPNGYASADPYAGGIDVRGGSGHLIGGTTAGEGNVISGNTGFGVRVSAQTTRVLGNSIYANSRLGIDLNGDEVTANNGTQSVSLPNNDMDHPVISSAGYDPGTRALTVTGYVGTGTGQALFAGARVELFTSDGDASGYGEGSAFVGTLTADANGRFSGTVSVPVAVTFTVGTALTGTATDTANNSSEFGPNYVTTTMSALAPSRFNAFETSTAAGALTGPIQTRVAGVAGNIALIAIDNTGTALQTAFAGTVTLEWMNAADNSGALDAGNCRASWLASGSAGSTSFVSGDQGRRNMSVTPAAVGREWRLRISYAGPGGTVTSCATDPFAVRPASLVITGVSDTTDTTAGTARALDNLAASGGRVHHAGRPFSLRAAARDAASAVTAGYTGTPAIAITGCVLPAGCTAGVLSTPALAASSGLIAADTLSYSEVGAINVQLTDDSFADIDIADTPLAQRRIQSAAVGVGRFVPDRYLLDVGTSPQFATQQGSCAAAGQGFTFVGQNFGWATAPSFTVTAQNAAGGTTTLWSGSLQKLTTGHIARSLAAANAQGLTPVVSWGSMSLTDTGAGTASVALSGDQFMFTRDAATPVASFNPLITLGLAVSDSSETAVGGNSAIASAAALVIGSGTGIAFNQGSNFHYARLKLQNAFGDARRGVRANVELQKFSARGWLRLSEDNTCLTVLQASVAFSAGSGAFATDVCTAPATAAVALRQGRGTLVLPKSAGNLQGAAMVTLNIGAALEGNACAAGVPVTPTSSAWPHLLGARGSGTTQDQNPAARLVWGRQHRDYMVMRELF